MKIEHIEILDRIDALCKEIDLPSHFAMSMKREVIKKLPQVREVVQKWDDEKCEHKGYQSSTGCCIDGNHEVIFHVCRSFENHQDLFNWCALHGVKLPQKAEKYASLNYEQEPVTELSYTATVDDVTFVVSYKRKGMPGNKCYIKEVVRKELVCDL